LIEEGNKEDITLEVRLRNEEDERVKAGLSKIYDRRIVTHFAKPQSEIPRYGDILEELADLKSESAGKPHYINAIDDIYRDTKLHV
jgi:hypothetical protein